MQKIDLTCPQCGASMRFSDDRSELLCEYCGHREFVEKKDVEEASYLYHRGRMRAEEEAAARRKKRERLPKIIALLVILGLFLTGFAVMLIGRVITEAAKPKLDPFQGVEVIYSGLAGEGTAALKTPENAFFEELTGVPGRVSYRVEPAEGLSNGDKLTLTAESDEYRLSPRTVTVTVEGLNTYFASLDELNEERLQVLEEKSLRVVKEEDGEGNYIGFIRNEVLRIERYGIYLLAAEDPARNLFYDVYKITYRLNNESEAVAFAPVCYEGLYFIGDGALGYGWCGVKGERFYVGSVFDSYVLGYPELSDFENDLRLNKEIAYGITSRLFENE